MASYLILTDDIGVPLLTILPVNINSRVLLRIKVIHHAMHLVFVQARFLEGVREMGRVETEVTSKLRPPPCSDGVL